jgi:hypothetical protein
MNLSVTFIRIPKNASTSIYEALGKANTVRDEKLISFLRANDGRYGGILAPSHCLLSEAVEELGGRILNVPSFAVVRNPYDRLVSMFVYIKSYKRILSHFIDPECSFDSFCRKMYDEREDFFYSLSQKSHLVLNNKIKVDEILRFENINEEFKKFISNYEIKNVDANLPHKNSTRHSPYQDFFNEETKKVATKLSEEDLDEFKYTF